MVFYPVSEKDIGDYQNAQPSGLVNQLICNLTKGLPQSIQQEINEKGIELAAELDLETAVSSTYFPWAKEGSPSNELKKVFQEFAFIMLKS